MRPGFGTQIRAMCRASSTQARQLNRGMPQMLPAVPIEARSRSSSDAAPAIVPQPLLRGRIPAEWAGNGQTEALTACRALGLTTFGRCLMMSRCPSVEPKEDACVPLG